MAKFGIASFKGTGAEFRKYIQYLRQQSENDRGRTLSGSLVVKTKRA